MPSLAQASAAGGRAERTADGRAATADLAAERNGYEAGDVKPAKKAKRSGAGGSNVAVPAVVDGDGAWPAGVPAGDVRGGAAGGTGNGRMRLGPNAERIIVHCACGSLEREHQVRVG